LTAGWCTIAAMGTVSWNRADRPLSATGAAPSTSTWAAPLGVVTSWAPSVGLVVVSWVLPAVVSWIVVAAALGGAAGRGGREVLRRLRAPVVVRAGPCEAAVAAGWALVAWRAASGALPAWWAPVPAALVWVAVVLTASDLRHRLLPDRVTLPAYPVLAALLAVAASTGPGPGLAIRAAAAGVAVLAVHAVVHLAAPAHLGAGDVKLAGPVGAVLGAVSWPAVPLGLALAAVTTMALAAVTRCRGAPHGPGLLAATLLVATFPATTALAG
jgi:leader peptidase (prepilin peptidase) / N-methyltransferase